MYTMSQAVFSFRIRLKIIVGVAAQALSTIEARAALAYNPTRLANRAKNFAGNAKFGLPPSQFSSIMYMYVKST